jgi:flagellar biosynthesis protein FlhB
MKTTKKIWGLAKGLMFATIIFWIMETVIFLIIDGWHLTPIREAEKICDNIVEVGAYVFLLMYVFVATNVIDYLLSYKKD